MFKKEKEDIEQMKREGAFFYLHGKRQYYDKKSLFFFRAEWII
jgi:hypothetical protein